VIDALRRDYRRAPAEPREHALLDYAANVTVRPWTCTQADVESLREHGWTDEDILDANQVIAYFNLLTRTIDRLAGGRVGHGDGADVPTLDDRAVVEGRRGSGSQTTADARPPTSTSTVRSSSRSEKGTAASRGMRSRWPRRRRRA
jgi:hypothetical protein